jgi:hypothetical protein
VAEKRLPKKKVKKRVRTERHARAVPLGEGIPNITVMREELADMKDVLLGRKPFPIEQGDLTLMEVADAYYARAAEMTMLIQQAEADGFVAKNTAQYKFRTGELRTFMEMAKRSADLGSRRLTQATLRFDQERYGRETAGE